MRLKKYTSLPIDLVKSFQINHLKYQFKKDRGFEILNPEDFEILDFYPDLLVRYMYDIFLIHFIDDYTNKNELFFLSILSLSFKRKYEREKKRGKVIILFYTKKSLPEEQREIIKLAERSFDMFGEIDVRKIEELEEVEDFPNYLEHKVWYPYYAYFLRYKEKDIT